MRRMTQTFHGWDQPDIVVTLPKCYERPGEHHGLLRAWAVDDETGDWWAMCNYYVGPVCRCLAGSTRTTSDVVELTDNDGLIGPVA